MANNKTLNTAKDNKNDEFYTQLTDIEKELKHYKSHFKDTIVFCNCDDPEYSNFWKYFYLNFEQLGLKKLIATHYETEKPSYKLEYDGTEIINTPLEQNGDFRSPECIEILKECDIVCTNPPFSLFREYIAQLTEYKKNFLIIGNPNALHYKEIFPLVKDNKLWLGYKSMGADMLFIVSEQYAQWLVENKRKGSAYRIVNGQVMGRTQAVWYTNLDISKRHEELILYKKYNSEEYPKYENFDAIEVSKVNDIPEDYFEMMGVPDGFLEYYNPEQFELIGIGAGDMAKQIGVQKNYRGRTDIAYKKDGKDKCPYSRIIIRRKK